MAGLKARTRLLILALLILGGATALTYDVWKLDMRLKRDVSVELLHGRHTQAQQILELLGRPFTTLVNFEYTLWDEMYAFVGTPRRSWATSNIDVLLDTYALDAVWVCATNGRTVYGINRWQMPELETLALLDLAPRQMFAQTSSVHFFVYSPAGLLEMRGAQIQPSEDNARRAAPAGYFFAARRWDAAFLQRLGVLVHATPELLPLSAARGATQDVVATTLMSLRDWRGAPLLNLRMTTASPVTQLFDAAIDNHTFHLMLRNAAILLLIIAVTYRYFNRPLAQISLSLERNEPQIVAHLMADTSEFGRIARLITTHARQKEELQAEVQTREQSQRELQQAKDTAEMINRIVPSAVLTVDAEQRILTWNKKAEELTGYTAAEIIGQRCTLFTREPCTSCCGLFNPARTAPIVARECTIETKDGRRRTILKNAEMFYDSSGRLSGIESFVDISERKQAEQALEKVITLEQDVVVLQQALLAPAALSDKLKTITDGIVRIFGADFCRIWLIQPGDLCEKGCIHAKVKEGPHVCRFRDKCLHLMASSGRYTHIDGQGHARVPFGCYKIGLIASGEEHKFLTNHAATDARVHNHAWVNELGLVSFAGYQLRVPAGDPIGVMALFSRHAISSADDAILDSLSISTAAAIQEALAEEALRFERQQLRTLIDNVPDLIYVKDMESRFMVANEALARISGVAAPAQLLGHRDGDFFPSELVHHYLADEQRVLRDGVSILNKEEQTGTSADSLRWMATTKIPLRDATGDVIGLVGIGRDISARKQAEAYMEMGREVLQILNEPGDLQDAIQRVLATVKARTGFDAVGIRLQEGDDFPYFAQQGFSKEFLLTENSLVARAADGGVCRDKDGHVSLVCTCGLVIAGKTDPAHPLFTRGGSFWTNDSFPLLDLPPDQDPRYQPRNQCIHCGYASVALIPIRSKDTIVGLIHIDDQRKGCFSLDLVEQLEGIAAHIGAALMRKQAEDALQSKTALLEAQTNATIDGILVVGDNNQRLLINQRLIALFKIPPPVLEDEDDTALLTHIVSLTKHPDDFLAKVRYLNAHPDEISRDELEFKSGMVLDRYSAPVLSKEGEHYGRLWIFREITERKQMEQTLYQRDALLQATAHASHILLAERDMDRAISTALETIGRAANQDRAYIFENHVEASSGTRMMSQRYEWTRSGVSAQIDNPELQNLSYDMLSMRWYDELGAGRPIEGCVRDFPESERVILEPQDIVSLLVVPITIEGAFWGFIGFDNCHSVYAWSDSERSILTATAAAIGTAIVQHRARRSLQHRALFGEIMIDIASLFVGTGNVDEAINQALAMVGEFVGADAGSLYLMSGGSDTLVAAHTWQRAQDAPAVAALSPANLAALVPWTLAELRRQRIVLLPSREQAPRARARSWRRWRHRASRPCWPCRLHATRHSRACWRSAIRCGRASGTRASAACCGSWRPCSAMRSRSATLTRACSRAPANCRNGCMS